jgi:hypothetical protein
MATKLLRLVNDKKKNSEIDVGGLYSLVLLSGNANYMLF